MPIVVPQPPQALLLLAHGLSAQSRISKRMPVHRLSANCLCPLLNSPWRLSLIRVRSQDHLSRPAPPDEASNRLILYCGLQSVNISSQNQSLSKSWHMAKRTKVIAGLQFLSNILNQHLGRPSHSSFQQKAFRAESSRVARNVLGARRMVRVSIQTLRPRSCSC